jgi:hypothetical protein
MHQHQDYDKIIKESISRVAPSLVEKLCGIKADKWKIRKVFISVRNTFSPPQTTIYRHHKIKCYVYTL